MGSGQLLQIDLCMWERIHLVEIELPLSLIKLTLGYSAFVVSISLPQYYKAKEKYEEKDTIVKLIEMSLNNWIELWEAVVVNSVKLH